MKVNISIAGFEFKRAEFSDAFKKAIALEMRNAAKKFVEAALPRVPVRTGFARGTLLNLSDAVGYAGASNKAAFIKKLDKRRMKVVNVSVNGLVEYYERVPKTPENARQFSTPMTRVFTNNGKSWSFNYENTVLYYELNDAKLNWRSYEFGSAAFIDYLERTGLQRIPAITEYLIRKRLS